MILLVLLLFGSKFLAYYYTETDDFKGLWNEEIFQKECERKSSELFYGWPRELPGYPKRGQGYHGEEKEHFKNTNIGKSDSLAFSSTTIGIMYYQILQNERDLRHAHKLLQSGVAADYEENITATLVVVLIPLQGAFGSEEFDIALKVSMMVLAIFGVVVKSFRSVFKITVTGEKLKESAHLERQRIRRLANLAGEFSIEHFKVAGESWWSASQERHLVPAYVYAEIMNAYLYQSSHAAYVTEHSANAKPESPVKKKRSAEDTHPPRHA
jgi:hypothetical protein